MARRIISMGKMGVNCFSFSRPEILHGSIGF